MNKKSILITGAASGIGRETALFFAKKDWFVGIFDVNDAGLKTLESEIGKPNCFSGIMDVADPESVQKGVDAFAKKTEGNLNVLLNNAGILEFGLYENIPLKRHLQIVDVNFKGCLNCIYSCLPYLKKTTDARIINMSSISSLYGAPELSVYASTKHALSAMTEALDIELEPHGIVVCDIKPPYVKTPMLKGGENSKSLKILRVIGGQTNAGKVAKTVWKAANKNKLHWKIGFTHLMAFHCWFLPFTVRFVVKLMTMSGIKK
ncbi:MAG: SDR family oxidoreductase [Desulfobacteraceae bacterium]|nr:SDR family oxidoreductase [Desulfobacteraceae bacterium]MBC2754026.1 SDR family oxidoreductase [Desulfobacteraceae bacterium]